MRALIFVAGFAFVVLRVSAPGLLKFQLGVERGMITGPWHSSLSPTDFVEDYVTTWPIESSLGETEIKLVRNFTSSSLMSDIKTINSALMGGPNDIPGGTGPGPGTGANPANPNNWTLFAPPSERTATEASEDGQEAWIYPPVGGDPSTFTRGEGVVEVDDENTHSEGYEDGSYGRRLGLLGRQRMTRQAMSPNRSLRRNRENREDEGAQDNPPRKKPKRSEVGE